MLTNEQKRYTAQELREFADAIALDLGDNGHRIVEYTYDDLIPVIESLRQAADAMESEGNKCGDCAKFGGDCSAGDVDGNEDCRACKQFVSKEVSALRALVKELADALETINSNIDFDPSIGFKWTIGDEEFESLHTGALVAKAREVTK